MKKLLIFFFDVIVTGIIIFGMYFILRLFPGPKSIGELISLFFLVILSIGLLIHITSMINIKLFKFLENHDRKRHV